jgi:hypothetical protein
MATRAKHNADGEREQDEQQDERDHSHAKPPARGAAHGCGERQRLHRATPTSCRITRQNIIRRQVHRHGVGSKKSPRKNLARQVIEVIRLEAKHRRLRNARRTRDLSHTDPLDLSDTLQISAD